ncbi:hypothetical protein WKV44_03110 [Spirochaetia bacterium 38H-sp]|uniref:Uncharacterized protein n=1 Tax=Rarispira pelagica TaxID=3141764 RepID=A0ABU9UA38_9SPIR
METVVDKLWQTFLLVIGIASPMDHVELFSPSVFFVDDGLKVDVSAKHVLNDEIYELLGSGIPVDIIGVFIVRGGRKVVFNRVVFVAKIRKVRGKIFLNDEPLEGLSSLGRDFERFVFFAPLDVSVLRGKKLGMRFELKLYSSVFSGVRDLWGNSPHIDFSAVVP